MNPDWGKNVFKSHEISHAQRILNDIAAHQHGAKWWAAYVGLRTMPDYGVAHRAPQFEFEAMLKVSFAPYMPPLLFSRCMNIIFYEQCGICIPFHLKAHS